MRFAWTACKFKGLHFCQFFNDFLRLFEAISLNLGRERDQENGDFGKNGLEAHHPKILQKTHKMLPQQMADRHVSVFTQMIYFSKSNDFFV